MTQMGIKITYGIRVQINDRTEFTEGCGIKILREKIKK